MKKIKKERTIQLIKKLQKQNEKLSQSKSKSKSKQKEKSYEEYFQECIKNKTIPKDAPYYLKKALKRAMKEYKKGIKLEKSALTNFAEKVARIKDFLRNHRNIKVRMLLICEMEQQIIAKSKGKSKINFSLFPIRNIHQS